MGELRYAVLGPLASAAPNRAFLGCVVRDGVAAPEEPIAVVWLPDELAYDRDALNQLRRQAEWVRSLRHPHIVGVHGIESFDEGWARIVEMIDGEPLTVVAQAMREHGLLDPEVVVRIGLDAAAGLQHAHEFGESSNGQPIVHGGIRPETLMMGFDGRTRVSGFGASAFRPFRTLLEGRRATAFLAPEQLVGGPDSASVRTDVYGLAAVLFELLTGAPPFWEEPELERAIMTKDLQLPSERSGSEGLMATLRQGLHRKSPERFATMADFAAALVEAGPCDRETVVARLDRLFPPSAFIRSNRQALLQSAADPDTLAILEPSSAEAPPPSPDESSPWSEAPQAAAREASGGLAAPIPRSVDLTEGDEDPITHFDQKAGDGSRTALAMVAVLAFVCIAAVAWFGKGSAPEGLDAPSSRHELPPEMLAGAFESSRAPPPPEATGPVRLVDLKSTPEVEVYRGDRRLGRTPLQVELRAGRHELRLTDAQRLINVYRTVEVRAEGEKNVLSFSLQPATLQVQAPSGASVFLNDVALGRAPLKARTLYEGRYLLLVQHLGQRFRAPLVVKPGQRVEVVADFD